MICVRSSDNLIPLSGYRDYHILHSKDGFDTMTFRLAMGLPQYPLLMEEGEIVTDSNEWTIKKINDDVIECDINLDFLKGSFFREYSSGSVMLQSLLTSIFDGWTITGAGVSTILRTISMENCTLKDVVLRAETTYNVYFEFNAKDKIVKVTDASGILPTGEYITNQLNLKTLSYRGETTEFVTRLFAYGAEGMGIEEAEVNGQPYGLPYIDNNTYSSKVICGYWEDERYTDPTSLFNAAQVRLSELAIPSQSYECSVIDLAKLTPEYSFLEFVMHRKLTLIDTQRGLRVVHQICEYDEYPEEPTRNVVTLASAPQTVSSYVEGSVGGVLEQLNNAMVYASETREITKELTETIVSLQATIADNQANMAQISLAIDNLTTTVATLSESLQSTQTASEQRWDWVQNNLKDSDGNSISEYIRMYRGSMCLGSSNSPIKLRLENNGDIKRFIIFSGDDFADEGITIFASFDASEVYDQFVRALSALYVGTKTQQTAYMVENNSNALVIRRV